MDYQFSFWETGVVPRHSDVTIAGGGFAGLWCALEVKQRHPATAVIILEKTALPGGASTRNAGFACFGSPTEMLHDAREMGEAAMWRLVEMRYRGIRKIRQLFGDAAIDFDPCGGYECLTAQQAAAVADKLDWLNNGMRQVTGHSKAFVFKNNALTQLGLRGFDALVENDMEGGLHSGKLYAALLQRVKEAGVQVIHGVQVTGTVREHARLRVLTNTGKTMTTGQLIYCTNAFTPAFAGMPAITPARGQVLLTAPVPALALRGTFHYDEGFYYWRNVGNRVLLGGARNTQMAAEATTVLQTTPGIQQALEDFLYTHILPGQRVDIDMRWSGIMGFTRHKMPMIHRVDEHTQVVAGCNGMGVALLPVLAEALEY